MSLDPTIHQPTRLRLMAMLVSLYPDDWIDFTGLKDQLGLTDGNLGAHIQKLEEAAYLEVDKRFVQRRPKTTVRVTERGRAAFAAHREALREILGE